MIKIGRNQQFLYIFITIHMRESEASTEFCSLNFWWAKTLETFKVPVTWKLFINQ